MGLRENEDRTFLPLDAALCFPQYGANFIPFGIIAAWPCILPSPET